MTLSFPLDAFMSIGTGLLYHHPRASNPNSGTPLAARSNHPSACALIAIRFVVFGGGKRNDERHTDELLQKNAAYTDNVEKGPLPLPPAKGVAVVACMDARLNVYGRLGLQEGDAHLIRDAGGAITDDEIRSLTISQLLPGRREAILIHHTDSFDTK